MTHFLYCTSQRPVHDWRFGITCFSCLCGVTQHCASSWIITFSSQTSRPWSSHQHASVRTVLQIWWFVGGDIVHLQPLQGSVQLTQVFVKKAHICLTVYNSLHFSSQYLLNHYSDKEIFWALTWTYVVLDDIDVILQDTHIIFSLLPEFCWIYALLPEFC